MPRYRAVPRPLIRWRQVVVTLVVALLPVLAACHPGAGPTRTPTPLRPTSRATPTDAATSTPTRRPTRTPLPTVDAAVPLPVAMTLEEARAEVWSWLDPAHAPRIVSVDYVPGAAVATHTFNSGEPFVVDYFDGMQDVRLLDGNRMPPSFVRVVAECAQWT